MNKARITYRFDHDGHRLADKEKQGHPGEESSIIPLQPSEYKVEDEPMETSRYVEDIKREDSGLLNQYTSDFGAWSSPFDAEVERLEQLIRSTDPKFQQMEHLEREEFPERMEHVDRPNEREYERLNERSDERVGGRLRPSDRVRDERDRYRDVGGRDWGPVLHEPQWAGQYVRKSRTPWMKMIASVSGAIMTGLLLGWFVLSLFSGEEQNPPDQVIPAQDGMGIHVGGDASQSETNPATDSDQQSGPIADVGEDKLSSVTLDEEGHLLLELPAMSYTVLQHGVFSTPEAAQAAVKQLQDKGFSGVIEKQDDYYVYAGLATNRDDVLVLKHMMDQAGLESYIKEYTLPAVGSVAWTGEASTALRDYFVYGYEFVAMISRLSILQLGGDALSKFEASTMESLSEFHRKWSEASTKVAAEAADHAAADQVQRMNNALNTAYVSLDAYNKNLSSAHLWQAQAAASQYTLLARGVLNEIGAD